MNEELYQLSDGRCISSPELSLKMEIIKAARPESYQSDSTGYSWDEAGMADLFAECYENEARHCAETKCWYTYDGTRWVKDIEAHLVSVKIKEFTRLMVLYCGEIEDEEVREKYLKFVNKMGDRRFRDRLLKDAADILMIKAETFDANPYLINTQNGTFDLETGSFYEPTYADYLTMQTNFEYTLQDVRCERWISFIKEITQNDYHKADYLQRALGYSILGTSREECMFILHGKTTRNGKSTLLDAIQHLLGDYATTAPVELICKSKVDRDVNSQTSVLAKLKGRRFVTMSESEMSSKLNESTIKQYTGGEQITARELYQSPITFTPQFTMWLSCNDLPAVRDKSIFASDRIRVIEFNRHFTQQEQDKNLKEYFKTPEAMKGIFSWLVEGFCKYYNHGLDMPESMREVVKQYEKDNDLILQFLEERCEVNADGSLKAKSLYDSYKLWCKSNGYYVCTNRKFNSELTAHTEWYDRKTKSNGNMVYYGISFRSDL